MKKYLTIVLMICMLFTVSCDSDITDDTTRIQEVEITPSNFQKFFDVRFDLETVSVPNYQMPRDYTTYGIYANLNMSIVSKTPGSFKNVKVVLYVDYGKSDWEAVESSVVKSSSDGMTISTYLPSDGDFNHVIRLEGAFLRVSDGNIQYLPDLHWSPTYRIKSVSGSYVPNNNEDVSSYL